MVTGGCLWSPVVACGCWLSPVVARGRRWSLDNSSGLGSPPAGLGMGRGPGRAARCDGDRRVSASRQRLDRGRAAAVLRGRGVLHGWQDAVGVAEF